MINHKFLLRTRQTLIGAVSVLALSTGLAMAQDAGSATIRGNVSIDMDLDISVQLRNVDNGNLTGVQTDGDGYYSLLGLAPGRYQLIAIIDGEEYSSDIVDIRLGQVAELDISSGTNTLDEIVIIGKRVTSGLTSEIGSALTPEQIRLLPQGNRNFLGFADTAPGVVTTPDNSGNIQFRAGAQRANGVNVFIDGVSQKDFVLNGGITGQDSSRGNPFPQSAISEYNVISSNFKAEYDQIGSSAIVAATKKGGNELHGGIFYDFTDESLRSKTPLENSSNAEKADTQQKQYGGYFSGPIIKDKLHFFVSYERKENRDLRQIIPRFPNGIVDNLPSNVRDAIANGNSTFSAPFNQDLIFVKLDWNLNENHDFAFSVKQRSEEELRDIGGFNRPERATNNIVDDLRINAKHEYRQGDIFNELTLTYEDARRNPTPATAAPGEAYDLVRFFNSGERIINLGGSRDFQDKGQKGWGIQDDFSWRINNHALKAGFKYKSLELSGVEINPFNPEVIYSFNAINFDFDADTTTILAPVPYRMEFTQPVSPDTPLVESDAKRFGIYLQDDWKISEHLTLNLGVRWDYEEISGYSNYVTPTDVVSALRANPNINDPDTNYNIEDYISTGSERGGISMLQPRIGFSWNLTEDRNHRLFGGVGRSANRIQYDFLQLEPTRERFSRFSVNFLGDHGVDCPQPCIAFDPAFLEPGGAANLPVQGSREVFAINNDLKMPYSDQYSLSIRSLWPLFDTEFGVSRVESRDEFVFLLGNRRSGGLFYPDGFTFSRAPFGESIGSDLSVLLLGTNAGETNLNTFYGKIEKSKDDSWWGGSLLYTYADGEENVRFGGPFDSLDPPPGRFGFFKAAGVNEHSIIGTFIADLPLDINFSSKLTLRSAPPFYGQKCDSFGPDLCRPVQGELDDTFNFKQLDVALVKNFHVHDRWGGAYVRVDVLNLFNNKNYLPGPDRFIGPDGNPNFGVPNGAIVGLTRTLKFSVGYNF